MELTGRIHEVRRALPRATELRAQLERAAPWLVVGLTWTWTAALVRGTGFWVDEDDHFPQIANFLAGNSDHVETLTVIPTLHAFIAGVMWLVGAESLDAARLISGALAVGAVAAMASAVPAGRGFRAAQWAMLPLVVPYAFVVYTDIPTTGLILLTWILLRSDRPSWAGVVATVAVLVRHSEAPWVMGLALIDHLGRLPPRPAWSDLLDLRALARYLSFLGPIAILAGMQVATGGLALGDEQAHRVGVHGENLLAFLMVAGVVLWPLALGSPRLATRASRLTAGMAVLALAAYLATWSPDHQNNQRRGFARNTIILEAQEHAALAALLGAAVVLGVWVLARIRLRRPQHYLVYLVGALACQKERAELGEIVVFDQFALRVFFLDRAKGGRSGE